MAAASSLELVVMMAKVRTHSSVPGRCQFSQMPASYGVKLLQTVIASERERLFELYAENCVPLEI